MAGKEFLSNAKLLVRLLHSNNLHFLKFAPPGHYYSPIPDMSSVSTSDWDSRYHEEPGVPGIEINDAGQLALISKFAQCLDEFPFSDSPSSQHRYWLDNEFFSYGDGVALYGLFRQLKPRRIIEIGSGYSSAAMLDLDDIFSHSSVEFVFVEPHPRRLYGLLRPSDRNRHVIIEKPVQEVPLEIFSSLNRNDILFIDSSHVTKFRSDVNRIIFRILPRLNPGVVVHFHDIPWPFEYPEHWIRSGRAWNEAYLVRSFLQFNSTFKILFFGPYLVAEHSEVIRNNLPLMLRVPSSRFTLGNTSLWVQKIA